MFNKTFIAVFLKSYNTIAFGEEQTEFESKEVPSSELLTAHSFCQRAEPINKSFRTEVTDWKKTSD